MLGEVLNALADNLKNLGLFNEVYALCDRVSDGSKTFPAFYTGQGNYKPIPYDSTNGLCYFRKAGKVSASEVTEAEFKTSSCPDLIYKLTYPVRLVCFIPKSKAACDDAFTDDYFADRIIASITTLSFAGALKARTAKFISNGYESDNLKVLQEEYSNHKDITDINYKFSYLAIDFNFEVVINRTCLDECEFNFSGISSPFITLCNAIKNCTVITDILSALENLTSLVIGEVPTGLINGSNVIFTTANNYTSGKIAVYKNGQRLISGTDYTETGANTYTVTVIPLVGDAITNDYIKA